MSLCIVSTVLFVASSWSSIFFPDYEIHITTFFSVHTTPR
jgi:hypothetical protein